VIVNNTGSSAWITTDDVLTIEIQSPSLDTVQKATVKRLMPGDAAVVEVGVQSKSGVTAGSIGPATAVASWGGNQTASLNYTATYGIPQYQANATSVNTHQSPDWFRKAKYGIFIHWGVYAVPAYGSVSPNESYAEW
jgi:alpha-L-fucosidase